MKEIFDFSMYAYNQLIAYGFNLLSIVCTILVVDFLKNKVLVNVSWYNEKSKGLINLGISLLIAILFTFLFFNFNILLWDQLIKNSIVSFSLAIASHNIMKALYKIIPGKQEGEDD